MTKIVHIFKTFGTLSYYALSRIPWPQFISKFLSGLYKIAAKIHPALVLVTAFALAILSSTGVYFIFRLITNKFWNVLGVLGGFNGEFFKYLNWAFSIVALILGAKISFEFLSSKTFRHVKVEPRPFNPDQVITTIKKRRVKKSWIYLSIFILAVTIGVYVLFIVDRSRETFLFPVGFQGEAWIVLNNKGKKLDRLFPIYDFTKTNIIEINVDPNEYFLQTVSRKQSYFFVDSLDNKTPILTVELKELDSRGDNRIYKINLDPMNATNLSGVANGIGYRGVLLSTAVNFSKNYANAWRKLPRVLDLNDSKQSVPDRVFKYFEYVNSKNIDSLNTYYHFPIDDFYSRKKVSANEMKRQANEDWIAYPDRKFIYAKESILLMLNNDGQYQVLINGNYEDKNGQRIAITKEIWLDNNLQITKINDL